MQSSNLDRAKQFLPFDALKGFRDALLRQEKIHENKKELLDDYSTQLNDTINLLREDMLVKIVYYQELEYMETIGRIKKIDKVNKRLVILNSIIDFDDIMEIEM